MTESEFGELLNVLEHETRRIEAKEGHSRADKTFMAKIARSMLGMANTRDGGTIIIGIEDDGTSLDPTGLSAADLATWNHDDVAAAMGEYADPPIELGISRPKYQNKDFVVIRVHEFDDVPVLCSKGYNHRTTGADGTKVVKSVTRKGACYVRSRQTPGSSEIPTQAEMRELLEIAVTKRLRVWVQQAQASGLLAFQPGGQVQETSAREQYEQELGEL